MTQAVTAQIQLDRPRTLILNANTTVDFEDAVGVPFYDPSWRTNLSGRTTRALLWAMLKQEDPELTLEQAGALIHPGTMAEISRALQSMVQGASKKK